MAVDTQKLHDLLQQHGGMTMPSDQQLDEHKAAAYKMLDSKTRGRCVSIDANRLIDLVATARALPALLDEIDRLRAVILAIDSLRGPFMSDDDIASVWRLVDAALNPPAPPQGEKDA